MGKYCRREGVYKSKQPTAHMMLCGKRMEVYSIKYTSEQGSFLCLQKEETNGGADY